MEQLALLGMPQMAAERPAASGKTKGKEAEDFQKLMDQSKSSRTDGQPEASDTPQTEAPAKDAPESQEPQPVQEDREPVETEPVPAAQDPKELERQMILAAMAVARNNPELADLAQETPAVLSDPSWEEGLVPVGFDDFNGMRIVHWMQPEGAAAQPASEEAEDALAQWMEESNVQTAAEPEAEAGRPEAVNPEEVLETPEASRMEVRAESGEAGGPGGEEDAGTPEDAPVETPVFEDVKTVPVKVGEAPATEKEPEVPVEKQVAAKLAEAMHTGESKVEIQLEPENLGKVKIEMTLRQDGSLLVQLHADSSRTQGLLEKNLSGLEALLSRTTEQEVQVQVPRQQESQQQNLYDQEQARQQNRQQQEQQRRRQAQSGEDFLQQLRLGLIPIDGEL